jgi:hypothetical protein
VIGLTKVIRKYIAQSMDKESDGGDGESPRTRNPAPAPGILRVDAPRSRIAVQVFFTTPN